MTGREYRGDTRGLTGLPQVAVEVQEGYFTGKGHTPEKCVAYTTSWAPQPTALEPEKYTDNTQLRKVAGFLSARDWWLEMQRAV